MHLLSYRGTQDKEVEWADCTIDWQADARFKEETHREERIFNT
jgi:hypothetical protein